MTSSRLRPLALVAAALLALGGCAVPGKGEPGVVAMYRDRVITDGDITEIHALLDELCAAPNAGEDLTLLILGPEVVVIADELGLGLTDEQLVDQAEIWIAYTNQGGVRGCAVTADSIEIVRIVEAINLLMHDPDGVIALIGLVQDVEANITVSPRFGAFTLENFSASITSISDFIQENETKLSVAQYIMWKDINAFDLTDQPDWVSGG